MSTSILPGERPDRLEEECAVFGVFAPGEDVARMTCFGLQALQHRGQESAGIAVGDGETIMVSKDLGLVTQVFDEASLAALDGFVAVGHARYSTSGGAASLINTNAMRTRLIDEGVQYRSGTDSEVAAKVIGQVTQATHHLRNGIRRAMEDIEGAYAMVLASPDSLYAFRDPNGIRPLCIGALPDGRGWVVSSETCGLDIVGAQYVRDVEPGEIVKNRYVGRTFIEPTQAMRQLGIRLKLNPLRSVIEGQRLVVIDDSIVRGNTSKKLVQMLRDAGAAEVHLRIVSPEVMWPCFYGIDTDTRDQLIAANMDLGEMNAWIGSDSLAFISLEGLRAAVPDARRQGFCDACFTGDYPVAIPDAVAKRSFLTKKDFDETYGEDATG